MIYQIKVNGTCHFKDCVDKREARNWAIEQAGIEVEQATTDALYQHMQEQGKFDGNDD